MTHKDTSSTSVRYWLGSSTPKQPILPILDKHKGPIINSLQKDPDRDRVINSFATRMRIGSLPARKLSLRVYISEGARQLAIRRRGPGNRGQTIKLPTHS